MLTVVTGASGLVGGNLAILLRQAGHEVRCTKRARSRLAHLDGFGLEWVDADIEDRASLERAFAGAAVVFHCAARVSVRRRVTRELVRANVRGTQNVLRAARTAGVKRVVHCSTVAARAVSTTGRPVTEDEPYNLGDFGLDDGYSRTKRSAERVVQRAVSDGQDVVIVNPSYMFGPYDARPSSGEMILQVMRGTVPGTTLGVSNFVDVRDVCRGMIAAWEKGRTGQAYILGGYNMTYEAILTLIASVARVPPPRLRLPLVVTRAMAAACDLAERLTGREGYLNSATLRYSGCTAFCFSSEKAMRELGYAVGPLEPSIADAIAWFRERKMIA